ncbi:MAG: hydroxyacid dehydrogenase [Chloroflexi bacterium]|nr:hydroxyacid dehydrogenase [Chloroflexota bacterium]
MRVLLTEPIDPAGMAILAQTAETVFPNAREETALAEAISAVDAVIVRLSRISGDLLRCGHCLKVVGKHGIGVDNIDVATATELGIWVVNTPLANIRSVAEYTWGLILGMVRRIPQAHHSLQGGEWQPGHFESRELAGKTLGIIGLGNIGFAVARLGRAFGMKLLVYDPYVSGERLRRVGAKVVDLRTLLQEAAVVTIHVPLTAETRGLLGEKELSWLSPASYLVNTARGGIVDEAALCRLLQSGHLAGAALDVFATEPLPADSPLHHAPNLILTPHIAAATREALQGMAVTVAEEVVRVLQGKRPRYPVNEPFQQRNR